MLFLIILLSSLFCECFAFTNYNNELAEFGIDNFFRFEDGHLKVKGNGEKKTHSRPVKLHLGKFKRPAGAPPVTRYFDIQICADRNASCYGHEEKAGMLLCYIGNLRDELVGEQFALKNVRDLGCLAPDKLHGVLFQFDRENFLIDSTFDEQTYVIPANHATDSGELCMYIRMGSHTDMVTRFFDGFGNETMPKYNGGAFPGKIRDLHNNVTTVNTMWQWFMDFTPVHRVAREFVIRGGGSECLMSAKFSGGSTSECRIEEKQLTGCANYGDQGMKPAEIGPIKCEISFETEEHNSQAEEQRKQQGETMDSESSAGGRKEKGTEAKTGSSTHQEESYNVHGEVTASADVLFASVEATVGAGYDNKWGSGTMQESTAHSVEEQNYQHVQRSGKSLSNEKAQTVTKLQVQKLKNSVTKKVEPGYELHAKQRIFVCNEQVMPTQDIEYWTIKGVDKFASSRKSPALKRAEDPKGKPAEWEIA